MAGEANRKPLKRERFPSDVILAGPRFFESGGVCQSQVRVAFGCHSYIYKYLITLPFLVASKARQL